jgi:hypothetical protein
MRSGIDLPPAQGISHQEADAEAHQDGLNGEAPHERRHVVHHFVQVMLL